MRWRARVRYRWHGWIGCRPHWSWGIIFACRCGRWWECHPPPGRSLGPPLYVPRYDR